MIILSIDTSCDETSAAVTLDRNILANTIWSQASLHAKYGGVYPSLAQRAHRERIDWVITKALRQAFPKHSGTHNQESLITKYIDAIAVTAGPGLAIALGVGIEKAKELATRLNKSLIAVNHLEGHILSPLARPKETSKSQFPNPKQIPKSKFQTSNEISFPAFGLVVSGKNTLLVQIEKIGHYKTLATVVDDALGEALDKAARMLGFGYPGGAILEKLAKKGDPSVYSLPVPLIGQEQKMIFSYSGLKTAMWRLVEKEKNQKALNKNQVANLAANFQKSAFEHLIRVLRYVFENRNSSQIKDLLVGGGVASNAEVRKLLRILCKEFGLNIYFPYSSRLYMDNAAMIGLAAYFKAQHGEFERNLRLVDREASAKVDRPFKWQIETS